MEWSDTKKLEIVSYASKITTPRSARQYLRLCLERIEVLERANKSFGDSFERFSDQLPEMLQNEIDRISDAKQLNINVPDELAGPGTPDRIIAPPKNISDPPTN